ncbi:MAG: hypothetical protein IJN10_04275 [Firmicutes bacterium]|nr:hypothetical protein [Bacillota bacterium]
MKYTMVFFLVCFFCFFVGCKSSVKYDLLFDESKISLIQIVEIGEYNQEKYEFELRKIAEISEVEQYLDDFEKIQCKSHYSAPLDLEQGSVVAKIMYESGEYELISWYAQSIHTNDGVNYGNYELDKKSFLELIREYS